MSILALANTTVTWKRSTAFLLDSVAVASSHTPSRQPPRATCIQVKLTGTPTGAVTITGTVDGVADSEVLTWTGTAGARATIKQFTAHTNYATSLTGAVLIEAMAVGPSGAPQASTYDLKVGHPVELVPDSGSWPGTIPGHERSNHATLRVQYEETWAPREGDILVDAVGQTWQVESTPRVGGALFPDHWKCRLVQREGA